MDASQRFICQQASITIACTLGTVGLSAAHAAATMDKFSRSRDYLVETVPNKCSPFFFLLLLVLPIRRYQFIYWRAYTQTYLVSYKAHRLLHVISSSYLSHICSRETLKQAYKYPKYLHTLLREISHRILYILSKATDRARSRCTR